MAYFKANKTYDMAGLEAWAARHGHAAYDWGGPVDGVTAGRRYSEIRALHHRQEAGGGDSPAAGSERSDEMYHLVPRRLANGGVVFTDVYGHGTLHVRRRGDGLPEIIGPRGLFTLLGGRAEADSLIKHVADGDYFNDTR